MPEKMNIARFAITLLQYVAIIASSAASAAAIFLAVVVWDKVAPLLESAKQPAAAVELDERQSARNLWMEGDVELGFRPVPLVHFLKRDPHGPVTEVATDARGFRIDAPTDVQPSRIDILAVGCSQTWGQGVPNQTTYVSRVGREFGVTVANAAVSSYATTQAEVMLDRHKDLRPRIVIYGLYTDHLFRNFEQVHPRPALQRTATGFEIVPPPIVATPSFVIVVSDALVRLYGLLGWPPEISRAPVESYVAQLVRTILDRLGFSHHVRTIAGRPNADQMPMLLDGMRFALDRMIGHSRAMDATLVVVWIPQKDPPSMGMPAELTEFLHARGVIVVDTYPAFAPFFNTPRITEVLIDNDWHLNERGHALVAEMVSDALAAPPLSLRRR